MANYASANVTVIDGATYATHMVLARYEPAAVALNPVTNKIYVSNQDSLDITVIDGATNATQTIAGVVGALAVGAASQLSMERPMTPKLYKRPEPLRR